MLVLMHISVCEIFTTAFSSSNPNTPMPISEVSANHSGHKLVIDGSHSNSLHSGMKMYFHAGYEEDNVLFSFWAITSVPGMVGSCIGIFIFAMLYEGLKVLREYLLERANQLEYVKRYGGSSDAQNSHNSNSPLTDSSSPSDEPIVAGSPATAAMPHPSEFRRAFGGYHLLQTVLHILQVTLSYALMLIAMTFNIWLFLAVVFGAGAGHLLFGWRKRVVYDALMVDRTCH